MSVPERRQYFRIKDHVYFDFKLIESGQMYSDQSIADSLLNQMGNNYLETTQYFQNLDLELSKLTHSSTMQESSLARYLNLLNAKIDCLARHLLLNENIHLRAIDLSLGGMSFKTENRIKEKTHMKIILYTKPKMVPIILDAVVIYSQFYNEKHYRTAVQFEILDEEQEQLLSQHIMLAQTSCQGCQAD